MDFARYLVHPERWEHLPADWAALFGRTGPLAVEIGFGNGEFLAWGSRQHPDWNWVGFETSLTCVAKAGRKLAQAGAENVRLALADGRFALRELFPDESVDRAFVHFPCPWPKTRHAERRVMDGSFSRTLSSVLAAGGLFELTTDVLVYAQDAAEHLASRGFRVAAEAVAVSGPGTRYEAKWRTQGREIWRLTAGRGTKENTLRITEGTMPHVRVPKAVTPDAVERLAGLRESWPGGAFVVKGAFFSLDGGTALLRTFATDEGFQQQYLLVVAQEEAGAMVKLDGATVPFRTPAVKRSVAAVAAALEAA
ncbi:MAG: tRNA (guanosine(46)-N7)-methyltransferase TrmB [Candidatus Bipolaricaulota bacterium]